MYAPSSNILPWDGGCAQTPCPDAATSYDIGNNDSGILPSGFLATQTGNDELKWETTTETNLIRHLRKLAGGQPCSPIVFEGKAIIALVSA